MRLIASLLLIGLPFSQLLADTFQLFEENGKTGLKNQQGIVLIPAAYEALGWSDGSFSVLANVTGYKLNGKWGLITTSNQQKTAPEYDQLVPADSRRVLATVQSPITFHLRTGLLSVEGKIIIPFEYTGIKLHGLRAITYTLDKNNRLRYGLIDLENKTILPALYSNIYPLGSLRYAVQNTAGKTALFTENGRAITGFVIDSIGPLKDDRAIYYQNGKQGILSRNGTVVKEAVYRELKTENGKLYGKLPDEWTVLAPSNSVIKKLEADSMVVVSPSRYKLVTTQGTQLLDERLNPVIKTFFESLSHGRNNLVVISEKGKKGIIHTSGSEILRPVFNEIKIGNTHLFVKENRQGNPKWSLFDYSGNRVSKKSYDYIEEFTDRLFRVTENGFQGAINNRGGEQLACVFDSLLETNEDLLAVKFRGLYGILSDKEAWIVTPQPNPIRLINRERFLEQSGNLVTLKSIDGNVLYFTTNEITLVDQTLREHLSSGGQWTLNLNGQIIARELPPSGQTEQVWPASEGLRMIKRNGRYGFIDNHARLMIPNRYEEARPFENGFAPIRIRNKWGFINHDDKLVVQPVYEHVSGFENGHSRVKQNGKYGLINTAGDLVLPTRYDELNVLESKRILLSAGGLYGLASEQGDVLLFPKYESITDLNNGYAIVILGGKYGVTDLRGLTAIPLIYDFLFFNPEGNLYIGLVKKPWEMID